MNPFPTPHQLLRHENPEVARRVEMETLRRRLDMLQRRLSRIHAILKTPMWEHLALFIIAIGFISFARTVNGPAAPAATALALALGVFSIARPLITIRYHLRRGEMIIRMKREISDTEDELEALEQKAAAN